MRGSKRRGSRRRRRGEDVEEGEEKLGVDAMGKRKEEGRMQQVGQVQQVGT